MMPRPKLDETLRRDVERTRQERLRTRIAMRAFVEDAPRKLDTTPAQAAGDWWRMHDERVQQIVEAALEVERQRLVEITRTMTDFVEKTVGAMDRMKSDIDKMFDTLKRSTADDNASAMQRHQRMQAH
jgi:hypothetical protein